MIGFKNFISINIIIDIFGFNNFGSSKCGCCGGTNFKDNDFCFLMGHLDKAKVIKFISNSNSLIEKIKGETDIDFKESASLFEKKNKKKLTNSTEEIAIKNFMCLVAINFVLSRSYNLLVTLTKYFTDADFMKKEFNENDRKKKGEDIQKEFKSKTSEYIEFLDSHIKKTLSLVINKEDEKINLNDFIIKISRKCNECFTKFLYGYVYELEEAKKPDVILDCLVSYVYPKKIEI